MEIFNIPKAIYLYDEGIKELNFKQISQFIKKNFGKIKICLIRLNKEAVQTNGLLLDFLNTQKKFKTLECSKKKDSCHIILTNKLFTTFDENQHPHIRASIYSFPSVISIPGIIEGPAKPKDYYLYKQRFSQLGAWEIEGPKIKQRFKGRFIDYGDKRTGEVLKGYIAQALFFYITAEPFCSNKNCRLYNAHWQEDLIHSQIKSKKFCSRHKELLKEINPLIV